MVMWLQPLSAFAGCTHHAKQVVFAVVADALIASKRAGKPLMAALFWNAAAPGVYYTYNVA